MKLLQHREIRVLVRFEDGFPAGVRQWQRGIRRDSLKCFHLIVHPSSSTYMQLRTRCQLLFLERPHHLHPFRPFLLMAMKQFVILFRETLKVDIVTVTLMIIMIIVITRITLQTVSHGCVMIAVSNHKIKPDVGPRVLPCPYLLL